MASLDAIVKFGIDNRINGEKYPPGHLVRKLMENQDNARKIGQEFRLRTMSAQDDVALTDEGKRRARAAAGKEHVEKLKEIEGMLARAQKERDGIAATLNANGAKLTDLEKLLLRDTQRELRAMEQLKRQRVFQQAIEDGDEETVQAFFNAPRWAQLLPDHLITEGKRLWADRVNPAAAAELADYEYAITALTENVNDVRSGIKREAGLEDDIRERLTK